MDRQEAPKRSHPGQVILLKAGKGDQYLLVVLAIKSDQVLRAGILSKLTQDSFFNWTRQARVSSKEA